MKNMKMLVSCFGFLCLSLAACGGGGNDDDPITPGKDDPTTPGEEQPANPDKDDPSEMIALNGFAKGADISWVTEMESSGRTFKNKAGVTTDCFALMKELGMNSVRLRVWVNPEKEYGPWSDAADVVAKAERAKKQGLHVMIDFHYSDRFADPGTQTKPSAWVGKSFADLKQAVASHTTDVLQQLKDKGITPDWVQVGNETRNGMIWPDGQLWNDKGDIANGWQNYAALSNAGYDAAKAVYPDVKVLVHNNNAWEDLDWWFKKFKAAGGKFDVIGLSHYPQTESKSATEINELALSHITSLANAYKVPVMIVEVGVKTNANVATAKSVLSEFYTQAKANSQCAGVFYWEPEVYGGWKPAIYNTWNWGSYDMGAFLSDGRPSGVMDVFAQ